MRVPREQVRKMMDCRSGVYPRPRLTRVGSTWNSIQLATSLVRSFFSSTFLLIPCRHDSRLHSGSRSSVSRSSEKTFISVYIFEETFLDQPVADAPDDGGDFAQRIFRMILHGPSD